MSVLTIIVVCIAIIILWRHHPHHHLLIITSSSSSNLIIKFHQRVTSVVSATLQGIGFKPVLPKTWIIIIINAIQTLATTTISATAHSIMAVVVCSEIIWRGQEDPIGIEKDIKSPQKDMYVDFAIFRDIGFKLVQQTVVITTMAEVALMVVCIVIIWRDHIIINNNINNINSRQRGTYAVFAMCLVIGFKSVQRKRRWSNVILLLIRRMWTLVGVA